MEPTPEVIRRAQRGNASAQEAVLRAAYAKAGVAPAAVRYVEAHGTGTLLGDPIEAKALAAVVAQNRDPAEPCLIGSVKSNVGHLEAAAGVAGLIKTLLVLRHRTIPPTIHYERPNPHIPFAELALRVADTLQPWPGDAPAVAVDLSWSGTPVAPPTVTAGQGFTVSRTYTVGGEAASPFTIAYYGSVDDVFGNEDDFLLGEDGKPKIDYRPVHMQPLSNEVESIPPKKRVY